VSTRIEVYEPGSEKPLARVTVPGEVTPAQLRKELRVAVTLVVDLGDKRRKKTFPIKISDDGLKARLEEYVDGLVVRLTIVEMEERVGGEYRLGEIRSE